MHVDFFIMLITTAKENGETKKWKTIIKEEEEVENQCEMMTLFYPFLVTSRIIGSKLKRDNLLYFFFIVSD